LPAGVPEPGATLPDLVHLAPVVEVAAVDRSD